MSNLRTISLVKNYKRIKKLGEGAFGTVELVEKKSNKKRYALKGINTELLSEFTLKSTLQEISILSRLKPCNKYIVCFEDAFYYYKRKGGKRYKYIGIVMEYFNGFEMWDYVKCEYETGFTISPQAMLKFIRYILEALKYLAENGIVHRDIKLENVLYNLVDIKLVDFGFSCLTPKYAELHNSEEDRCEGTPGTLVYAAPELFLEKKSDSPKIDIWAAGILFYRICNKKEPYGGDGGGGATDAEKVRKIKKGDVSKSTYSNKKVNSIIEKCLTPDPKKRPSAKQLLNQYF